MNVFAIHVVTESSDHYNMLIEVSSKSELIDKIRYNVYDFENISRVWVTANEKLDYNPVAFIMSSVYSEQGDGY